jgi:hypothetical protein
MSDLKLFKLSPSQVTELPVSSMALEKSFQTLIERLSLATVAKAFRGELSPRNRNDGPATKLLERLRKTFATTGPRKRIAKAFPR